MRNRMARDVALDRSRAKGALDRTHPSAAPALSPAMAGMEQSRALATMGNGSAESAPIVVARHFGGGDLNADAHGEDHGGEHPHL